MIGALSVWYQAPGIYEKHSLVRRVGESLKIRLLAVGTRGGADGYRDASFLLGCLLQLRVWQGWSGVYCGRGPKLLWTSWPFFQAPRWRSIPAKATVVYNRGSMHHLWLGIMYMKASDWLRYNQKRVKAKHNINLRGVYPGTLSLKTRYKCFLNNRVARGVRFSLDFRLYPFLVGQWPDIPVFVFCS